MTSAYLTALLACIACNSAFAMLPVGLRDALPDEYLELADRVKPSASTASAQIEKDEKVVPEVQNYDANVVEPYSCSHCTNCCNDATVGDNNKVGNCNSNNNNGDNRNNNNGNIVGNNNKVYHSKNAKPKSRPKWSNWGGKKWSKWGGRKRPNGNGWNKGSGGGTGWRKWAGRPWLGSGRGIFGKRRWTVADSPSSRSEETLLTYVQLLGSKMELKLYDSYNAMAELMASPVIRAELYERPLASDVSETVASALNETQSGVVATLSDGRRFFFVKGNQLGRGKETIIILANHMSDDWVKQDSKDVVRSTLADFYVTGGKKFDLLTDNGNQAATRMMALP